MPAILPRERKGRTPKRIFFSFKVSTQDPQELCKADFVSKKLFPNVSEHPLPPLFLLNE